MNPPLPGLPRSLGRYELLSLLGQGGMGRVIRAHDPVLRRDVALKLVETTGLDAAEERQLRYLFHREARATAALQHPNIIEIYDYSGFDAEYLYLACELLEGATLRDLLESQRQFGAEIVASLGYELASALGEAHRLGILHRDLKPENVFWLPAGRVVLCDFGIAKALEHGRLGQTVVWQQTRLYGSPAYMAPELLQGESATPQADLFSLGAVLFECLSGTPAFDGDSVDVILAALLAERRPILPLRLATPARLSALVYALLAPNPAARPTDAASVSRELRAILDELGVTDPRVRLLSQGDDTALLRPIAPEPVDEEDDDEPPSALQQAAHEAASGNSLSMAWLLAGSLGLAIAVYFVIDLFRVTSPGTTPMTQTLPPSDTSHDTVLVELQFPQPATLWIDGELLGAVGTLATLPLRPGPHHLVAHLGDTQLEKEITIISGTSPRFVLTLGEAAK